MWQWTPLNCCHQHPSPVVTMRTYQRLVTHTVQSHCYTLPGYEKCENASHWVKTKMSAQLRTSANSERESSSFSLLLSRCPVLLGYCPLTLSRSAIHHPIFLGYQVCCSRSLVSLSTVEGFVDAMKVRRQIWESKAGWSAVTHLSAPSRLHVRDQYSITVRSKTLVPLMFILCLPREFSSCKMSGSRSTGCQKETILRWCQMQSSELWAVIQLISTFKKTVPTICRPGLDGLFRWGNGVRSQHALQSRHQISPMA